MLTASWLSTWLESINWIGQAEGLSKIIFYALLLLGWLIVWTQEIFCWGSDFDVAVIKSFSIDLIWAKILPLSRYR